MKFMMAAKTKAIIMPVSPPTMYPTATKRAIRNSISIVTLIEFISQ
jgi:hypothetical protein